MNIDHETRPAGGIRTDDDRGDGTGGAQEHAQARVLVVSGASGSGKSRLARHFASQYGWPSVNLDDFYKDHDDPTLPRLPGGEIDWDGVQSWNREAAVTALTLLCRTGSLEAPVYSIATSQRNGSRTVTLGAAPVVVAEGIFAPHIIARLREEGLLAAAWCLRRNRYVTALRRLVRDLAEHRKPPPVLVRRGWRRLRAEPVRFKDALRRAAAMDTSAARSA